MGWVSNEGVDINGGISPVSSPVTVLSHCGEFQESKVGLVREVWFNLVQIGIVWSTKPHTPNHTKLHRRYAKTTQSTPNYTN